MQVNERKRTILNALKSYNHNAFIEAFSDCTEILVNHQDDEGWTILHYAVVQEHKMPSDVQDRQKQSSLIKENEENDIIIDWLLENNADIFLKETDNGSNPAHFAAMHGSVSSLSKIVHHNPTVLNEKDVNGATPLWYAASRGECHCVQFILDFVQQNGFEIDINMIDDDGWTPLRAAVVQECERCVEILLQAGADLHLKDSDGCTALHGACLKRNTKLIQLLLDFGHDVYSEDMDDLTPLHYCVQVQALDCLKVILDFIQNNDLVDISVIKCVYELAKDEEEDDAIECIQNILEKHDS